MSQFNEENSVENFVRDQLCGKQAAPKPGVIETYEPYVTAGRTSRGTGWHFAPAIALPRQPQDVFVEKYVREALIRLNPAIAAQPDRADEVIHKLRVENVGSRDRPAQTNTLPSEAKVGKLMDIARVRSNEVNA